MSPIIFEVRGEPKPQPRPRAFARKTAFGTIARVYDAGTAESWKSQVAEAARPFIPLAPLEGPLAVELELWLPRPLGHFTAGKKERGLKRGAPEFHVSSGDADNFAKAVLDALTVLRFWHDDAQVARLIVTKAYEDPATGPGALVRIEGLAALSPPLQPQEEQPLLVPEEASR